MPTLYFESYDGCYANIAEGAAIRNFFVKNGYWPVESPEKADLVVYNTCAYDRPNEDRVVERIKDLQVKVNDDSKILISGCLPGINPQRLQEFFHGRSITPNQLVKLDRMFQANVSFTEISSISSSEAVIKIATGCLGNCTFCGIKNSIGNVKSRPIGSIIDEFEHQYSRGKRRFVFASHDFGAYGLDMGSDCIELLKAVPAMNRDFEILIEWIDPRWLHRYLDGFIEMLKNGVLAKRFFVSLQSGSDRILKLMSRHYTVREVHHCFQRILYEVPDFQPQVEFIVGFPTESDDDFRDTIGFVRQYAFQRMGIYKFDLKPNTPAEAISPRVPDEVIQERYVRALELKENNERRFRVGRFVQLRFPAISNWIRPFVRPCVASYEIAILPLQNAFMRAN